MEDAVRKQVEFYLSPANLAKDRFLADLLARPAGAVDVHVVSRFARVRKLCDGDTDLLSGALEGSALVEVVRSPGFVGFRPRAAAVPSPRDVDARTVFVSPVPEPLLDHDRLRGEFEARFGPVALVSLPRNKLTREFKGFAFVEFQAAETAAAAAAAGEVVAESAAIAGVTAGPPMLVESKAQWLADQTAYKQSLALSTTSRVPVVFSRGVLFEVSGLPEAATKALLREVFEVPAALAFVEFHAGADVAHVRYETAAGATVAAEYLAAHPPLVAGARPAVRRLAGDEELEYWRRLLPAVELVTVAPQSPLPEEEETRKSAGDSPAEEARKARKRARKEGKAVAEQQEGQQEGEEGSPAEEARKARKRARKEAKTVAEQQEGQQEGEEGSPAEEAKKARKRARKESKAAAGQQEGPQEGEETKEAKRARKRARQQERERAERKAAKKARKANKGQKDQ